MLSHTLIRLGHLFAIRKPLKPYSPTLFTIQPYLFHNSHSIINLLRIIFVIFTQKILSVPVIAIVALFNCLEERPLMMMMFRCEYLVLEFRKILIGKSTVEIVAAYMLIFHC